MHYRDISQKNVNTVTEKKKKNIPSPWMTTTQDKIVILELEVPAKEQDKNSVA